METAWIAIVVTISLFVVSHIIITVWWASKVNTTLDFVQQSLTALIEEIKMNRTLYVNKNDYQKDFDINNKDHGYIWEQLNKLKL